MEKVIRFSELELQQYDQGKNARQTYLLLLLITLYFTLSVVWALFGPQGGLLWVAVFYKLDLLTAILLCWVCFAVHRAQKKLGWPDYLTLSALFEHCKKHPSVCAAINDLAPDQTGQDSLSGHTPADADPLTSLERDRRKKLLRDIKYGLWLTNPAVKKGILLFGGGAVLLLAADCIPAGNLGLALEVLGSVAYIVGGFTWFIAWYKLL